MEKIVKSIMLMSAMYVACSCGKNDGGAKAAESVANDNDVPEVEIAAETEDSVTDRPLRIAVAGDIMMGTTFPDDTPRLPAHGGRHLFDAVKPVFSDADVVCANLEGVLMEPGGEPRKMGKDPKTYYIFRMPEAYVNNLVDAGIDFVAIASNHANDMQQGGRVSTKRVLKEAGVAYAGQTDCPTAVIERAGRKIGIAAFGHSGNTCHTWEYDRVKNTVAGLDSICDIVIVSFHGGAEGSDCSHVPHAMEKYLGEKRGDVEKFAHTAVDAGADVVYGHGPHVTRAVELYNDRFIVYSLGNFCTASRVSITGEKGYAPVVTVETDDEGRFTGGKIHSFIQQYGIGPKPDTAGKVAKHMRRLSEADFPGSPLRIADDGTITVARREAPKQ